MKWFNEVTEWTTATPNHTYLLDDSKTKMFAYLKFGRGKPIAFSKPISIDLRGRKFKVSEDQPLLAVEEELPEGKIYEVASTDGKKNYKVSELGGEWSCSCTGFKFHGKCKHIDSVKK